MTEKPYGLLNRVGLIGLYRMGLFDNDSCGYEGTFFQMAWESCEIPRLFQDLSEQMPVEWWIKKWIKKTKKSN